MTIDPRSVAGKRLAVSGHAELLVVGAGPAGLAAAIEAARRGLGVTLVDENPVSVEVMAESVPLQFGQRMSGAVRNRTAMTEAMLAASPDLADALELGVDVRLGTACWGLFVNTHNLGWLERPLAGLIDPDSGSTLLSFDAAVIATGRRDMGLAFPGWDQPGVLGATAALSLAGRYGALDGRRAVVLGTTAEAVLAALTLAGHGIAVDCLVEQAERPAAPASLLADLDDRSIPIRFGETIRSVETDANGVCAIRLTSGARIACDLVVIGVGVVPVIDLLAAAGAQTRFDAARGGFVPAIDGAMRTSLPCIHAAGDCTGIWPHKSSDPAVAQREGRLAVAAIHDAGSRRAAPPAPEPADDAVDLDAYRKAWVRATVVEAGEDAPVCLCEGVTARDVIEVAAPGYLNWQSTSNAMRSLPEILGEGPPNPDQIKRLTRAGMGPCQGRRCREQVQALLALHEDVPLDAIPLASYRAPVRPIPLSAAAPVTEDAAITAQWDSWFGMPRQWVPFWDVEETYTVASLTTEKQHVSE